MITLSAREVADVTGGRLVGPARQAPEERHVTAVVADSRQSGPGALFVALPGERTDGHDHAAGAVAAGASLVLASREVSDPDGAALPAVVVEDVTVALGELARTVLARLRADGGPTVVAVTGSVGKTTTKDLLAQVLGDAGPTVWPERSFNNEIGLPLTVLRTDTSTRFLVLEMGASGLGHLAYLTRIAPPDVAVVLVVGSAHVGEFGGVDAIARAKAEIVEGLVPGGVAVLNADDRRVSAMAPLAGRVDGEVLLFGRHPEAAVRADDVRLDEHGRASFTLTGPGGSAPVRLLLVGEHHLHNALAAAAAALAVGLDVPTVAASLGRARALSPHRMQVTERPDGVTVIDDSYNANPDSMRAALKALAIAGRGRRTVAVLGEMLELGEDHVRAHDEIGRLVVRLDVDRLLVVGEGARALHLGATQEGSWGEESRLVPDLDAAADWLETELRPGDVVLVKSSHGAGLWRLADHLTSAVVPG